MVALELLTGVLGLSSSTGPKSPPPPPPSSSSPPSQSSGLLQSRTSEWSLASSDQRPTWERWPTDSSCTGLSQLVGLLHGRLMSASAPAPPIQTSARLTSRIAATSTAVFSVLLTS